MGAKRQTATDNYKHAERQTATDGQPLRMDAKRQTATDEYKHAERQTAKQNRWPWEIVTNRDMQITTQIANALHIGSLGILRNSSDT